jgi:Ca2+-binding RTX toxin-like protein
VIFGDQGEILRTASTESAPNYLVRARSIGFELTTPSTPAQGLEILYGRHCRRPCAGRFRQLGSDDDFISLDIANAGNGGADTIQIGHGSDTVARSLGENFILGGMAGDTIRVSAHRVGDDWVQGSAVSMDVIFGDQGEIVRTASSEGVPNYLQHVHSIGFALGGNNTIHTGLGDKVIVGGFGGDVITAATAGADDATGNSQAVRLIAGDHAQIDFDSLGRMTNFISLDIGQRCHWRRRHDPDWPRFGYGRT